MNTSSLPRHIGFIVDGNRRWSKEKKLPSLIGHQKGYEAIEPIIMHAISLKIPYLTFWVFSTENWNRSKEEVDYLMELFRDLLHGDMVTRLKKEGVRMNVIGQLHRFSKDIIKDVNELISDTKNNTNTQTNFALSYGGRSELVMAVNRILQDKVTTVDESLISSYLYTSGIPDPDLVIRTGGERRLSGFLPWQAVYSELYFTSTYWPDFTPLEFDKALEDYASRNRRFGK